MNISVELSERDGCPVVTVEGEVDMWTAPRLREQLVALGGDRRPAVIVDLHGVEFLDSTALGVLVGAHKRMATQGGSLLLVCTEARVLRVLEVTGLDRILPVYPSLDEAVTAT